MSLIIETFVIAPFGENSYLIGDSDQGVAIVVDPGGRAEDIVRRARQHELTIERIVNTHAHIDHVAGVSSLQALVPVPFWLHPDAEPMLAGLPEQAQRFGLPEAEAPAVDHHIVPGEPVVVGGLSFEVRHTPGHAPGHVTLVSPAVPWEGATRRVAFCGDVIFRGSIGRVDLPGGDMTTLMRSIEREILTLDDDTVLLSGHGLATTVGRERSSNPFVQQWLRGPGRLA